MIKCYHTSKNIIKTNHKNNQSKKYNIEEGLNLVSYPNRSMTKINDSALKLLIFTSRIRFFFYISGVNYHTLFEIKNIKYINSLKYSVSSIFQKCNFPLSNQNIYYLLNKNYLFFLTINYLSNKTIK